jgi:hypothetical protein
MTGLGMNVRLEIRHQFGKFVVIEYRGEQTVGVVFIAPDFDHAQVYVRRRQRLATLTALTGEHLRPGTP